MYELLEQIGAGSFSTVHRARRRFTGQFVACKVISLERKTPPEIAALRSEVAILRRLSHPHIIALLDVLETPRSLTLVTELAQGDLLEVLLKDGPLPEPTVRAVAAALTSALLYLHEQGIMHRDLKPQNVLVCSSGLVKLADFGFARELGRSSLLMQSLKGTPLYLAPEMFTSSQYTHAADVWALGALLYELGKGAPPFYAENLAALAGKIVGEPVDLGGGGALSAGLSAFLGLCLLKDPRMRAAWSDLAAHQWLLNDDKDRGK